MRVFLAILTGRGIIITPYQGTETALYGSQILYHTKVNDARKIGKSQ
jgi:hypothetical protein